jgi:glutamate:Na+ symporter, ESS family
VRMSDPENRSGAMESFGYKQLLFEPIVGGGLFTAASLPLIYQFGPIPVLVGVTAVMLGWLIFGMRRFGPRSV